MAKYTDDKMEWFESDIEKIQAKTGMYISYVGEKGALHLAKEAIQNAIDECANKKSPASKIKVILDSGTLYVEDDGRGIPEEDVSMEIVCTTLNSGSKFTRENSVASAGENGVGVTAVNALSKDFTWESYRDNMCHKLVFENGIKVKDTIKKSKKEHGTIISFTPSTKYLGKSAKIPKKGLIEWVENESYFLPERCKLNLIIVEDGKEVHNKTYKLKPLEGILTSHVSDKWVLGPYTCQNETNIVENYRGERDIKRFLNVSFTFGYTYSIERYVDSFCNHVNTVSGGIHLNAVEEAFWRFFTKKANDAFSDKEKEKYKILKVDVMSGLNLVVNLFTDAQMQFAGQSKNELSNDELYEPIKKLALEALELLFSDKGSLDNAIKVIKTNCKARQDATKIKTKGPKATDRFDDLEDKKFTPCNNRGKAYKELHICEGDSARGALVDARDPDTQAFLSFRGVTINGFKRDENTILENKEFALYTQKLGTGIGSRFDINKCNYDKIIFDTDSDVDGLGISSGLCLFHVLYLPELVKAGRVFKSIGPLYKLDDKKHPFAHSISECVELYQDRIIKNYKIKIVAHKDKTPIKKNEFKEFIYDVDEYSEALISMGKHFKTHKFLVELVAAFIYMNYSKNGIVPDMDKLWKNEKFKLKLLEIVQHNYPEMLIKGKSDLRGIIEGSYQSISINNRFIRKVKDLFPVFEKYGYLLDVSENDSKFKRMSIGQFLDISSKYIIKRIGRYKGLGEVDSRDLWDTTLNPDTRVLIQFTLEDMEKELGIFSVLHGHTPKDKSDRKKMMSQYRIKRSDLDN